MIGRFLFLQLKSGLAVLILAAATAIAAPPSKGVQVIADEAHRRVDITIDGKPFTSYIWPTTLKKPVLYPLITDEDLTVTRGYPLAPLPGERMDHPHQAGMWFNYGSANGFDFWNNSDAIKPEDHAKMGTILFKKIVSTKSGPNHGELVVESVWVTGKSQEILSQTTRYIFAHRNHARVIEELVTLKALDKVVFEDNKEGMLGIRVASWLESPEEKGGIYPDAHGNQTKVEGSATPGASGVYLTSEGAKGAAAWGTRARWCSLTGNTGGHTVTVAIFDNPKNPGYPTYWHARGYGLFGVNPLGRSIFDPKQSPFNFTLEKDQSATFRHRIALFSNSTTPEELNHEADTFAAKYR
jgi:hypothetical protein